MVYFWTDLQKRRERINERLRTLQHLVPNGTKVDISTMLEEAVQYVKFLQLQIKVWTNSEFKWNFFKNRLLVKNQFKYIYINSKTSYDCFEILIPSLCQMTN